MYKVGESLFSQVKNSPYNEDQLFEIAHQVMSCVEDDRKEDMLELAGKHGLNWAKSDLPIVLMLDWFRGLRGIYWDFLYQYYKNIKTMNIDEFFLLEKKTNYYLDSYLEQFAVSYNQYQYQVLDSQREMIEELTVPIIPLTENIAILPVVGTVDTYRAKKLQEKTLVQIEKMKFNKMIIDLSGVAYLDTSVVTHLFKIVDGIRLLGCRAIVTGIRSEVANTMIELGVSLNERVDTKADLKQALEDLKIV
ncbi:STAS domain-containing protein [Marinicrinis lubricantis]|uniref:STAS domain-containing protein n=1 Tax=Marinicrinis lubricantis TaxID=2086470 RepID=A0ABW1IVV1_9BACL